jgi:predicted ArsR family transcriptional regulator
MFITNHTRVLLAIAEDPTMRLRDIATRLDITERAAQRIVSELDEAGYLSRHRKGRRNVYTVHADQPLRIPNTRETTIGELLNLLAERPSRPLAAAA